MKLKELHIDPHLEQSKLILYKGLNRTVRLYRFVGDVESDEFQSVKDYFYHITPDFALHERLIGFEDYDDIGYYCQENDVWIVEELLHTPLELTISYEKQMLLDEKDKRERDYLNYVRKQKENIARIDESFQDATYPHRKHDNLLEVLFTSRVYVPKGRHFFSKYGVMYIVREQADFIARLTNSEYDNNLCNTRGIVRGVYCYTQYNSEIARLINETCTDETEQFRKLYSREQTYKGFPRPHDPCKHHKHVDCWRDKKGLY